MLKSKITKIVLSSDIQNPGYGKEAVQSGIPNGIYPMHEDAPFANHRDDLRDEHNNPINETFLSSSRRRLELPLRVFDIVIITR